ncbi:aminotransferase class I and II domain-containing protein [Sarocladium implicatum]|nr:aminotransferase class I and II domain-containing protein [Sarocladium implicatum]
MAALGSSLEVVSCATRSQPNFVHPGILNDSERAEFIRQQVAQSVEPWSAAFADMLSHPHASKTTPEPVSTVECGGYSTPDVGCSDEREDAMTTYLNALAWTVTGEQDYADRAIRFMDAWSSTIQEHNNSNAPLQAGWAASTWTRAAELIRHSDAGWNAEAISRFEVMLRKVYLPLVEKRIPNYNGNWDLIKMEAALFIAVFLDDVDVYNEAMERFLDRVPAYIYLATDGSHPKTAKEDTDIRSRSEIVAYWHGQSAFNVSGLSQETCRDFEHTGYGLASIAHVAETSRIQGRDLFQEDVGTRLRYAWEFHAKFHLGEPQPSWLCPGTTLSLYLGPVTEVAFGALGSRLGYQMPYTEALTKSQRPAWANKMDGIISKRSERTIAKSKEAWDSDPRVAGYDPETCPDGVISLSSASNRLIVDALLEFAQNRVTFDRTHLLYLKAFDDGSRFPSAYATHLNEYLRPHQPITANDIRVVNGATSMHSVLAWALADPGEAFLTSRPVYGRFELDFGHMSDVRIVYADTAADNCFTEDVLEAFEKALQDSTDKGIKIKVLLIANPNNPTGKCYPREVLVGLMKLCQKHRIHLFSDEVYACSVFDSGEETAVPFTSVLSIDPAGLIDTDLLHVEVGFSKDFGASGFRIGALVTRSKAVLGAIDMVTRFFEPAGPSLAIATAMLEDRDWTHSFIDSSRQRLAAAYKHVTAGLRDMGVEYLPGTNAGFFVWINLSPYLPSDLGGEENPEFALAKKLVDAGVFLNPREEKSAQPGWFRLVYTQEASTITEALKRIKRAIQ